MVIPTLFLFSFIFSLAKNESTSVENANSTKSREPKQILEEFFEDDDDESESTTMTLAQFPGKNSDMQCCACPGPTTPTLSSMMTFDFDENSDSFFETLSTLAAASTTTNPASSADADDDSDATEMSTMKTTTNAEDTTTDILENFDTTTNEILDETTESLMKVRGGKQIDLGEDEDLTTARPTASVTANNPLLRYLDRLQRIYELDLKILGDNWLDGYKFHNGRNYANFASFTFSSII